MDDATIRDLIGRLADPWKPTRNEAAQLLADIGEPALPQLRALLLGDDHDPDLAHYAVWILEQLDTPEADAALDEYWDRYG